MIAEASPLRVLFNPPWPSLQSYLVRLNVHFYLWKICLPKRLIGSGGALQPPISIANTQLKPNGLPQFLNVELVVCSLGFGFVHLTHHPPKSLPLPSLEVSLRLQVACRLEATTKRQLVLKTWSILSSVLLILVSCSVSKGTGGTRSPSDCHRTFLSCTSL